MRLIRKLGSDLVLAAILLLAAFLYGYGIWNDKYVNLYYTTAVGSMLQSWHNFFYASLDSAGSVTVDKPPVVFWIQALFAWIFGVKGWSVILPQVLAGVGSVLLVYLLVKPAFGKMAARIAALAMALTPVAAAVSRTNNIDAMLVFTLLLATWFLFRGTKSSKIGPLIAAFALIGVAFNEKMLQAYMVVPAFYLFYWLALKMNWKKKAGVLAACTAVMLAVSVSWAVIVDSIPASQRPFIGSSTTNSVMKLAFGYNGVSRLTGDRGNAGRGGFPQGMNGEMPSWNGGEDQGMPGTGGAMPGMNGGGFGGGQNGADGTSGASVNPNGNATGTQSADASSGTEDGTASGERRQNGTFGQFRGNGQDDGGWREFGQMGGGLGGMNGGAGGMFNTGTAGPLRLFQSELSGQASWLIPFILLGCVGIFSGLRRRQFTQKHKEAVFWLAWLIPVAGFFSIAGFFHQYYLIMMAPPIAALAGAGFVKLWSLYRERTDWLSWLLPAAILATAGFQSYILSPYKKTIGTGWSIGILAGGIAAAGLLALFKISKKQLPRITAIAVLLVLLIGPLYWSLTPIAYGLNSMIPAAGPDSRSVMGERMNRVIGGAGEDSMMGMQGGNVPDAADAQSGASAPNSANGQNGTDTQSDYSARDSRPGGGQFGFGGSEGENVNESLVAYLKEHNTGQEYLFAAMNYSTGGPYIIEGNKVVILNGFSGSDVVYTADTLQALVQGGKVKYFYISGGGMGSGREGNSELTTWITEHGTEIPSSEWQGASSGTGGTLYEVALN